jgi:hypothetical protein
VRPPRTRLVGLAAAIGLVLSTFTAAGPASAVDPGNGIISVKVVDDLGRPVVANVQLFPAGDGDSVTLGTPEDSDEGATPVVAASYLEEVATGTYGALAAGGWAGMTCVGLATCSPTDMMGGAPPTLGAGNFDITEGSTTSVTIRIATPKLVGRPGVGQPLSVWVPNSLKELANLYAGLGGGLGMGLSAAPTVAWNRNGVPNGGTGLAYTPTTADAGSRVSATISYPPILAFLLGSAGSGVVPRPFTTGAVSIGRLSPRIKLSVPRKIKSGKRPVAYVNVSAGQSAARGVVTFKAGRTRSQQAVLRSGLATFKLPKLKPGKHKVTVSIPADGAYNAAKVTKTVVVKGKKPKKKR